jgi:hypothetical protein
VRSGRGSSSSAIARRSTRARSRASSTAAFDGEPPPSDLPAAVESFAKVAELLDQQIEDLQTMKASGTLDDPERYFGVDAPSGRRWYNFDPLTYIECGLQGSFGGYQEGDDTGRELVPGEVAVLDEEGNIEAVDPHALAPVVSDLGDIGWEDVERFLCCGQVYE